MKIFSQTLIAMVLLCGTAFGALPSESGIESLRVEHQELPLFPDDLMRVGVREGEVRVALSIDNLGNLEDLLVLLHTHPRFAEVAIKSLKKWRFEPMRQNGVAVAATTLLTIHFESKGVVVSSMTAAEQAMLMIAPLLQNRFKYRMYSLRELDQIPTPIAAPAPAYPRELATQGAHGQVTVGFYIDETGAVRIPSVDAGDDPRLASLAIDALRQWRFEAPRCKGVPVLVKATQVFNFLPNGQMASSGRKK